MPQDGANAAFDRLAERIFESHVQRDPVEATLLGIHGSNDERLPDRSLKACQEELEALQGEYKELGRIRQGELTLERAVDLRLARGGLIGRILRLQKHPCWRESPASYVEDVVLGLYSLVIRDFAPAPRRGRALLGRLKQVPELLVNARANLQNPPAVFTETAALSAMGALSFFDAGLRQFIESLHEPRLQGSLETARLEARGAVDSYREWLEGSLMSVSGGDFAIGGHLYEKLLVEEHAVPWNADQLVNVGLHVYQDTVREIKRVAARIESGKPWSKVVETLKAAHPGEMDLLAAYTAEMERARAFVQQTCMVSLPEGDEIEIVPTPGFARPMFPYAAYLSPAPFEKAQKGTFWVTTIDPALPPVRRETLLRGHARYAIPITALHQAYPGHHLQVVRANQLKDRKLRFLFASSSFSEGWALYCEEMMYRHGFYKDDRVRLLQLKDLVWRACRIIIDVGLQTGRMGFNEAVTFLVRKARLERPNAVAEVRRYCANPTQPMGYVAGKLLIEELLEDYKAHKGDQFDQRLFHEEILSHGTIPVELIRMEMGIPRREPAGRGAARRRPSRARSVRAPAATTVAEL